MMDNKEEIRQLADALTLYIFNVGTDKTNFKILKMLPTDINTLMKELNLTKMPVNTRVNELEKVGLIKRKKGTGKVMSTKMAEYFLDLINSIKDKVEESIYQQLSEAKYLNNEY